jgi:hypothetical protein
VNTCVLVMLPNMMRTQMSCVAVQSLIQDGFLVPILGVGLW